MARILVSCIPFDGGKSGISEYTRRVVRELAAQGHSLTLLVEPDAAGAAVWEGEGAPQGGGGLQTADAARSENAPSRAAGGAAPAVVHAPRWTRRAPLSMLWHLLFLPFWIRRRRREFDGFFICAANRRVCAFHPLPTVATVHDLANFHIPGKYSRSRMFYLAHVLPFFAMRAHRLVAVSESTKADMVRFWRCPAEKVAVLYEGLPDRLASRLASRAPAPSGASGEGNGGAGPAGRNLLYISRIEHPGKNHVRLVEAYGRLPRALAEAHPLVLAGADWKDAEVVHEAAARSPHADCIRFAGFVPEDRMEALWDGAFAYVFPSLFEGFGLSLAEAMARGVPCACSENGSLGEIGGDAALKFDPESVESIAAALQTLLEEAPAARAARVARGLERTSLFSWPRHAEGIARLLR